MNVIKLYLDRYPESLIISVSCIFTWFLAFLSGLILFNLISNAEVTVLRPIIEILVLTFASLFGFTLVVLLSIANLTLVYVSDLWRYYKQKTED